MKNAQSAEAKNIRRRVYDALNVLVAIGAISKNRKQLVWKGLPHAQPLECERMRQRRNEKQQTVEAKKAMLSRLLCEYVARRNIAARNLRRSQQQQQHASVASSSSPLSRSLCSPPCAKLVPIKHEDSSPTLHLPFLAIHAQHESVLSGDMDASRQEVTFSCTHPLSVHDHHSILAQLGCQRISSWDLPRVVPRHLTPFYPQQCISDAAVFGEPKIDAMPFRAASNAADNDDDDDERHWRC